MKWPTQIQHWATSHGPGSFPPALYGTAWTRPAEGAYCEYRSVDDLSQTHQAGVKWAHSLSIESLSIRWRAGYFPREARIGLELEGHIQWLPTHQATAEISIFQVERPIQGYVIEQTLGSATHPGQLFIAAVLVAPVDKMTYLGVERNGEIYWPPIPTPYIELSDAESVVLKITQKTEGVALTFSQIGSIGTLEWLQHAWDKTIEHNGAQISCTSTYQDLAGVIAGTVTVALHLSHPVADGQLRIPLPPRPMALALSDVTLNPPQFKASAFKGATGTDQAFATYRGAAPDGTLEIQYGDLKARCLRIGWQLDGVTPKWQRHRQDQQVHFKTNGAQLDHTTLRAPGQQITVGIALHDGLWPLNLLHLDGDQLLDQDNNTILRVPGATSRKTPYEWLFDVDDCATVQISYFEPSPCPVHSYGTVPYDDIITTLRTEALRFVKPDDRIPYGLFPSVYTEMIFGLEEDYTFVGLAYWGAQAQALRSLRATYLTDAHLDRSHYLFDLRAGLTPWQTWRILRLCDQTFADLSASEQQRLIDLGDWILTQRQQTSKATGVLKNGVRVFPGLLPPGRYGGDLDFPTQSVTTNAAACVGLRALGQMTQDSRYINGAIKMTQSLRDALQVIGPQMHTGGGDPGDYVQLMAGGMLAILDLWPPDDPWLTVLLNRLDTEDRLWHEMPRFNQWSGPNATDPHYTLGLLQQHLRAGRRTRFRDGLDTLLTHAMDPIAITFREVTQILTQPRVAHEPRLPGRRLGQADPCIGGLGVILQAIREAFIVEMPDKTGEWGRHLRLRGGSCSPEAPAITTTSAPAFTTPDATVPTPA